jgi:hypothetical protein
LNILEIKMTDTTKRLEILTDSLAKKNAAFSVKLEEHYESVRQANGQPLNDKRNGATTLARWERQNNSLRNLEISIKKTEAAITKEKEKIANASEFEVPECLREMLTAGTIRQWRKHPRFFFVQGVDRARIVVREDGTITHRYVKEIPSPDQYTVFRDVFNAANAALRIERGGGS